MSGIFTAEPAAFVLPAGALVAALVTYIAKQRDRVPARVLATVKNDVTPAGATTPMNNPQSRGSTG